jgi:hypothetical protein
MMHFFPSAVYYFKYIMYFSVAYFKYIHARLIMYLVVKDGVGERLVLLPPMRECMHAVTCYDDVYRLVHK